MVCFTETDVDSLFAFVKSRPNITSLFCYGVPPSMSLRAFIDAETFLPNLSHLVSPLHLFLALRTPRPLQSLKIYVGERENFSEEELERILARLKAVNEAITALCLCRRFLQAVPLHDYICRLAKSIPRLQSLCIHDDSLRSCREPPHLEAILSSFTSFTRLENLAFNQCDPPPPPGRPQIPGGMSPAQFATRLMKECPSLRHVMLPFWDKEKLTYVKTPSGDAIARPLFETSCRGTCLVPRLLEISAA
ncbi:hypothetical protein JAAARDRAFT_74135 [Jaapia argillacea MUCL 33604]|uniref:F-box domain-containing protein n=1 Tax=Jaapia argillacea MUCL 33604 TaxID=933084 RepID=A0A067P9K0_9AGAM|nr:hypothetical protein JAAARDRAFT_74135 [Jaapia argillacea MUCL 33604]